MCKPSAVSTICMLDSVWNIVPEVNQKIIEGYRVGMGSWPLLQSSVELREIPDTIYNQEKQGVIEH